MLSTTTPVREPELIRGDSWEPSTLDYTRRRVRSFGVRQDQRVKRGRVSLFGYKSGQAASQVLLFTVRTTRVFSFCAREVRGCRNCGPAPSFASGKGESSCMTDHRTSPLSCPSRAPPPPSEPEQSLTPLGLPLEVSV